MINSLLHWRKYVYLVENSSNLIYSHCTNTSTYIYLYRIYMNRPCSNEISSWVNKHSILSCACNWYDLIMRKFEVFSASTEVAFLSFELDNIIQGSLFSTKFYVKASCWKYLMNIVELSFKYYVKHMGISNSRKKNINRKNAADLIRIAVNYYGSRWPMFKRIRNTGKGNRNDVANSMHITWHNVETYFDIWL